MKYYWCSKPPLSTLSSLFAEIFQVPYLRQPDCLQACVLELPGLQEWLLVYDERQLVAFLSIHERSSYTLIANLGVAPTHRHKGIATRMLEEVRRHRPKTTLRVEVDKDLVPFYEKRGFTMKNGPSQRKVTLQL